MQYAFSWGGYAIAVLSSIYNKNFFLQKFIFTTVKIRFFRTF